MPEVPIVMPQLGESIAEATIVKINVAIGDTIEAEQDLIEVETNKATMSVPTLCGGVIKELCLEQGVSYAVGSVLGVIDVTDEEIAKAVLTPPEDTRAYFRGECLKRYGDAVFGVNWDSISFGVGDEPISRILMAEPLKGTREHVGALLDSSPTAAELVTKLRA